MFLPHARRAHLYRLNVPFQSASGITVMIMAAACHPDAQARVQDELNEVVGMDRGISTL
jgi:hypothetical protein